MAERSAKQLGLSKADLPNSIIEVIATLTKSGFEAYIVGGGVRDTLLGLSPKDFDAVTDARPHEIKELFGKRCRIIGRRFQLAHVYSGRDMIEVATFRAPPNGAEHTTSDGMIVRDNVWGDIKQDFARRDFSINAMYYEPIKGVVHDFCDALDDIDNKIIRLLGRASLRIEEDPVRLLRALRFKAKLGFDFEDALEAQFHDANWALLEQVSPHRLYDESQKMFTGGYLVPLLPLLFDYGAIKHLIVYPPKAPSKLVSQVAINTDKRIALGKSINPAFFYAALLWDNYLHQLAKFRKKNLPFYDAQMQASILVIERQRIKTAIPRFAEQFIRDIWLLQPKLANPRVKQIAQLAEHARFRAAFDFLLLREQCDDVANPLSESTNGMGEWWQNFQLLTEREKLQAIDAFTEDNRRTPNKSSRNRRTRANEDASEEPIAAVVPSAEHSNVTSPAAQKPQQAQSNRPTKKALLPRPRSSGQKRHDAQERAQLKKLSLEQLLGTNDPQPQPPKPLFSISADKLAEQVPHQAQAQNLLQKPAQEQIQEQQLAGATITVATSIDRQGKGAGQHPASQSTAGQSTAVLLPKAETVPSKRRRRQPSQALSQKEQAAVAVADKPLISVPKVINAESKPTSNTEPMPMMPSAQLAAAATTLGQVHADSSPSLSHRLLAIATAKIPKTRQRRQPSTQVSQANQMVAADAGKISGSKTTAYANSEGGEQQAGAEGNRSPDSAPQSLVMAQQAALQVVPNMQKPIKQEPVPAIRRRRNPSDSQSVRERDNV